ncbi:HypC/HybG/HupF family hydrogenase formation chaperone [Jiella marina]|uniref:HypC/HybG/HupF family hydrogenase formation chaperone n=1 Tax=Jiella sp. LLJ827 TaxID=2917712 RepID=UPI002100E8C2|nr:HypC/HybG/HupF family hydrogenase formation chaperone [Jiella sp. LLJ827]MCQ0988713.1 HypC/HybG/HupF family hydrogenase formation chaperone [Jiella sp. LLJ827]
MCVAIPARVERLEDNAVAIVSIEGVAKPVSTALLDDVAVGDHLLVHAGYALEKLSAEEAGRTLALMAEAGMLGAPGDTAEGAP